MAARTRRVREEKPKVAGKGKCASQAIRNDFLLDMVLATRTRGYLMQSINTGIQHDRRALHSVHISHGLEETTSALDVFVDGKDPILLGYRDLPLLAVLRGKTSGHRSRRIVIGHLH